MIEAELLATLRCPESYQGLALAAESVLRQLNERVKVGQLRNRSGQIVTEPLDGGLVREDGRYLYPIRGEIPVLLVDEAIPIGVRSRRTTSG